MFKFTDEEKTFKDIVKEEVFRQYLVGNLLSLNEQQKRNKITSVGRKARGKFSASQLKNDDNDEENLPDPDELVKNFLAKPRPEREGIIKETNSAFISNLSDEDDFVDYTLEKNINNQDLFLAVTFYALGYKEEITKIKGFIYNFYLEYLLETFFKPTSSFFGSKSSFTGNKKIDKLIQNNIYKYFSNILTDRGRVPSEFRSLDNSITDYIENSLQNVKPNLNEGILTSINLGRLIFTINYLFAFNRKTNEYIKSVLSKMNKEDLKDISKGGQSNTASLITMAILERIADELKGIQIKKDKNLDKLLALIGYNVLKKSSYINNRLENAIGKAIQSKLEYLKAPKTQLTDVLASLGGFAR